MSEHSRRRSSKWDLKEGLPLSAENIRGRSRDSDKLTSWNEDGGYSTRMSPGLDDWRRPNHGHSPREKWNRPVRNRSRSQSRSRSPVRGLRQNSENYDRSIGRSARLCRDFGSGRCRRGSDCAFIHQGNRNYGDSWEDKHRRGGFSKYQPTHDAAEYPSRGSTEREHVRNRSSNTLCKFFAAGNCHNGKHCRFSHGKSSESPERKINEAHKYWEEPSWRGTGPVRNAGKFEDENGRRVALDQRVKDRFPEGHKDSLIEKVNRTWNEPTPAVSSVIPPKPRSSERVLDDVDMSPDWNYRPEYSNHGEDEQRLNNFSSPVPTSLHNRTGKDADRNGSAQHNLPAAIDKDMRFDTAGISQGDLNFSSNILHGHDHNPPNSSTVALPSLNSVGDSSVIIHPAQSTADHHNGTFVEGKLAEVQALSQVNANPPNNNSARLEQLTQVSNPSLVQILEAGMQHPQFYASLSTAQPPPEDSVDQMKSVMLNAAITPQEQYDHISNGGGHQKVSHVDELKSAPDMQQVDGSKTGGSDHVGPSENRDAKDSAEEVTEGSKKIGESKDVENDDAELENADGAKKEEDAKKNKEAKNVRSFKFALAESVKELLKPSWKDGLVGKDAYKTIVKKVVDKVTGSLHGANTPQSQEKIDHYLSASKPKLTKLVQAYVEKFQKPSKQVQSS